MGPEEKWCKKKDVPRVGNTCIGENVRLYNVNILKMYMIGKVNLPKIGPNSEVKKSTKATLCDIFKH